MRRSLLSVIVIALALTACSIIRKKESGVLPGPYCVHNHCYFPLPKAKGYVEEGYASWYGPKFHGSRTASGERFNMYEMTAAHRTLPFGTYVKVTRLDTGQWVIVRINDRGPFVRGRIIDLSKKAAEKLGIVRDGLARVRVEVVQPATIGSYAGNEHRWLLKAVPSFEKGSFEIQIASFRQRENAVRLRKRLQGRYDYTAIIPFKYNGEIFYQVRVGVFDTLSRAEEELQRIRKQGFYDAFVVARKGEAG